MGLKISDLLEEPAAPQEASVSAPLRISDALPDDTSRRLRRGLTAVTDAVAAIQPAMRHLAPTAATKASDAVIESVIKVRERFLQGGKDIADALLPPDGRAPGGVDDTLKFLGGAANMAFPVSAAAEHLGNVAGQAATRASGEMSDERLRERLAHAKLHAPGEVPFLEKLLAQSPDERIKAAGAGFGSMAEVGSGVIPGYTMTANAVRSLSGDIARRMRRATPNRLDVVDQQWRESAARNQEILSAIEAKVREPITAEPPPVVVEPRRIENPQPLAKTPEPSVVNAQDILADLAPAPGTTASTPVMITQRMRADLTGAGFSAEQIDRMTPQQAHEALAQRGAVAEPPAAKEPDWVTNPDPLSVDDAPVAAEAREMSPKLHADLAEWGFTPEQIAALTPEQARAELARLSPSTFGEQPPARGMRGRPDPGAPTEQPRLRGAEALRAAEAFDPEDIEQLEAYVRSRGGIKPSQSGDLVGEYSIIPSTLKNRNGMTAEDMALAVAGASGRPMTDAQLLELLAKRDRLRERNAASDAASASDFEARRAQRQAEQRAELANLPIEEKVERIAGMFGLSDIDAYKIVSREEARRASEGARAAAPTPQELSQKLRDHFEAFPDEDASAVLFDVLPAFRERFGDAAAAAQTFTGGDRAALEALVREAKAAAVPEQFGAGNTVFTREAHDEAVQRLRDATSGDTLTSGVDPTLMADLVKVGGFYLEGGLRDFEAWARKMVAALGDKVKPALAKVWESIQDRSAYQADTYRSALGDLITDKMPNAAPVEQVRAIVKAGGITADEAKWSGLDDFLATRNGKVTKDEVLEHLRANEVRVEEVVKGGGRKANEVPPGYTVKVFPDGQYGLIEPSGTTIAAGYTTRAQLLGDIDNILDMRGTPHPDGTKFDDPKYQLPGGEKYRELLLTLPQKPTRDLDDFARDAFGKPYDELSNAQRGAVQSQMFNPDAPTFRGGHFDEPNVLAHVRFNERVDAEGKKVLFLEEVQSDYGQKARKRGVRKPVPELTIHETEHQWVARDAQGLELGAVGKGTVDGRAEAEEYLKRYIRSREAERSGDLMDVPDAPFITSTEGWVGLAMKRMLRWAAENGFDRVAWTPGAVQAARYDLSKQVRRIEWGGGDGQNDRIVTIVPKAGNDIEFRVLPDGKGTGISGRESGTQFDGRHITDVVGKDIGDKILAEHYGGLAGNGLKVGGEGMAGFYDKILPEWAAKYGKKWGARVGETEIPALDPERFDLVEEGSGWRVVDKSLNQGNGTFIGPMFRSGADAEAWLKAQGHTNHRVHAIDITPEMRASVLVEGQPLFGNAGAGVVGRATERLRRGKDFGGEPQPAAPTMGAMPTEPGAPAPASPAQQKLDEAERAFKAAEDAYTAQKSYPSPTNGVVAPEVWRAYTRAELKLRQAQRDLDIEQTGRGTLAPSDVTGVVGDSGRSYGPRGRPRGRGAQGPTEPPVPTPAPRYEPTALGDQAVVPGTPRRAMPGRRSTSSAPQRPVEDTPLFGQERAAREQASDAAQTSLPVDTRVLQSPDGKPVARLRQLSEQGRGMGTYEVVEWLGDGGALPPEMGRAGATWRDYFQGRTDRRLISQVTRGVTREGAPDGYIQLMAGDAKYLAPQAPAGGNAAQPGLFGDERGFFRFGREKWTAPANSGLAEIPAMNERPAATPSLRQRGRAKVDDLITAQVNKFHPVEVELRKEGTAPDVVAGVMRTLELTGNTIGGQTESFARQLGTIYRDMVTGHGRDLTEAWNSYLTLKQFDKRIRDLSARQGSNVSPTGRIMGPGGQTQMFSGYVNPRQFDRPKIQRELAALQSSLSPQEWQAVESAAQRTWALNRDLLDRAHDAGIVGDDVYRELVGRGDDYVPIQVLDYISEAGEAATAPTRPYSVRYQDVLKRVEGTERDVRNVIESTMDKATRTIATINRNLAAKAVTDLSGALGPSRGGGQLIEKIAGDTFTVPGGKKVISVFEDGARTNYAVPAEIADAMTFLDATQIGWVGRVLQHASTPLRAGATGMNLGFALVTNPARDVKRTLLYSKYGVSPTDWVRGLYSAYKKDALYQEALESGALYSTMQKSLTPDAYIRQASGLPRPAYGSTTEAVLKSPRDILRYMTEHIGRVANLTEEGAKMHTFIRGKRAGDPVKDVAYETANYGGSPNFARSGTIGPEMNLLLMFYNARLQGTAANVRRLRESPGARARVLTKVGLYTVAPVATLWAWNQQFDGDHGLEDISEGDRQKYHVLLLPTTYQHSDGTTRRHYVKIAKEETDQLVGNTMEAALTWFKGRDPGTAKQIGLDLLGNLSPVSFDVKGEDPGARDVATALGAGALAGANPAIRLPFEIPFNYRAYSQGPIVSRGTAEGLLPEDQARPTTSPTMKKLGALLGMSPIKLEYAVTSGTGGAGQTVLDTIDAAQGKRLPDTVGAYEGAARKPVLSRILGTAGDQANRRIEDRFYRMLDEAQRTEGSIKAQAEGGQATPRLMDLAGDPAAVVKAELASDLRDLSAQLTEIRQAQSYITNSLEAPAEAKQAAMAFLAEQRALLLRAYTILEEQTANFTRLPADEAAPRRLPGR